MEIKLRHKICFHALTASLVLNIIGYCMLMHNGPISQAGRAVTLAHQSDGWLPF